MTVAVRISVLDELADRVNALERLQDRPLQQANPSGTSGSMEERVTRLETHMEYVRRDLDDIRAGQTSLLGAVGELKTELVAMRGHTAGKTTVIGTGLVVVGILLAVLAFGGDRFSQGMEVRAAAEAARGPWANDPIVSLEPAK